MRPLGRILRGVAGTAVALFVVFPLLLALLGVVLAVLGEWDWNDLGIPWLIALDLLPIVTDPVRDFLADDGLWRAWEIGGLAILIAAFTGAAWARAARIVLVVATTAMITASSEGGFRLLMLGAAVAWLSVEALLFCRRNERFRRAVRKATRPQPQAFADDNLELTVLPDPPSDR